MPIRAACQCGKAFAAPDNLAGKTVKCPGCGQPLKIPGGAAGGTAVPRPPAPAPAPAPAPMLGGGGLSDLLDEAGITQHAGPRCPACDAPIHPQALVCTKCGFNRQTGQRAFGAQIKKGGDGHGDMAASLLDRARREVEASPVEKDDESVGGVRSYWTWAFMLFLPLLFSSGFVVAAYLAGVVVGPAQVVKIALWNGNYQYLIPALVAVGGVLIIMWGITQVMDSVFDHSKHQGFILSGITIACLLVSAPVLMLMMGPAVYFSAFRNWLDVMMLAAIHTAFVAPVVLIYWWAWGTVFFRKAKRSMSILYTGIFTTQYGFLLLGCFTLYDANMLLPIVILHLSFIAQVVTTVGWLNITGYAGEEHWAHGLGSLLGLGIYPIVYGAMRWSKCKVWLIVYLIAWPMAIGTSLFASLGTAATNKIRSRIQADLAEARKQAAEAEAQK